MARILPLRKPGKPDYRVPKAYRPISLLSTLSKLMELVLARRLSYWAETFNLLPNTQFGARPRRSCDQALLLLTEKIYEAWQQKKVLSLVSFDVKGAYNGVPRQVLTSRLRAKGIPTRVVNWVDSFSSGRSTTVVVNGVESSQVPIAESGLPQGSTLAPILYIFFNSFLMDESVKGSRGNMGFVDDYSRWAVSDSIEQNMAILNNKVVPRALQWAKDSGATFESDKTVLMHFTRNSRKMAEARTPLRVGRHTVQSSTKERILGVIFDSELRFKDHLAKVKSRGWRSASQLKRLSHLGPKAARQLYLATVASKTDYAAAVWYAQLIGKKVDNATSKILNPIHRIGAQAVVKSFHTTSLQASSAEATLLLPHFRLQMKIGKLWVRLHSLPDSNPAKSRILKLRTARTAKTFVSPLQKIESHLGRPGDIVEVIPAWLVPPWQAPSKGNSDGVAKRDEAYLDYYSKESTQINVFADGSIANGRAGIGVALCAKRPNPATTNSLLLRSNDRIDSTLVELAAIRAATLLLDIYTENMDTDSLDVFQATIWSDSQRAIRAIRRPYPSSGSSIVKDVLNFIGHHSKLGRNISFKWIPKSAKVPGHVEADQQAKSATTAGSTSDQVGPRLAAPDSTTYSWDHLKETISLWALQTQWKTGNSLRATDSAIPGKHTLALYNTLSKKEAAILVQLRTGHSHLNGFLAKINVANSAQCPCGQSIETTRHFLLFCPRYERQRQKLADKLGSQFGNLSHMVGGRDKHALTGEAHRDGPTGKWKANITTIRETIRYTLNTGRLDFGDSRRQSSEEDGERPSEDEEQEYSGRSDEEGED